MNKYLILLLLTTFIIIPFSYSETWKYNYLDERAINYSLMPTVNSSDYWDDRDTPADITYDEISGGDVEALGYYGYFNGILGFVGSLLMDGDPWYLGGVDLEINQDLQVNNTIVEHDIMPLNTLTGNIGSGALRWLNIFVQNINAEDIEAFNIHATENITVDGYINGVNISEINISNYLNLSGTNANQNINVSPYYITASTVFADSFNGSWNGSTNYVPYTGATSDVDLGNKNLTTIGLGTFGNLDVDTLNLDGNVISDSTGTISFDNDNILTTGGVTSTLHYFGSGSSMYISNLLNQMLIVNINDDKDIIFNFNDGGVQKSFNIDASENTLNLNSGDLTTTGNGTFGSLNVSGDLTTTGKGTFGSLNANETNVSYSTFCNGANCWKMYVNASDYFIIEEI